MAASPVTIGELREGPLHAALKRWYARPGDVLEAPLAGFVIDIVRGDRRADSTSPKRSTRTIRRSAGSGWTMVIAWLSSSASSLERIR